MHVGPGDRLDVIDQFGRQPAEVTVLLVGRGSTDPDGQIVRWTWTLVESSGGSGGDRKSVV